MHAEAAARHGASREEIAEALGVTVDRFAWLRMLANHRGQRREVQLRGGALAADIFGFTGWRDDDLGIGQQLETLAQAVDFLNPMVYPSTFNAGLPGAIPYPDVVTRPYDVVFQSLKHAQQKLAGKRVVVRPWLQYFDDYPWATRTRYDAAQIEAQKKAVLDSTASGWMFWNPGSLFKRGGLALK